MIKKQVLIDTIGSMIGVFFDNGFNTDDIMTFLKRNGFTKKQIAYYFDLEDTDNE